MGADVVAIVSGVYDFFLVLGHISLNRFIWDLLYVLSS